MTSSGKATRLELFNFKSLHTRTFHMTWMAFFLCFFGWFGLAPLTAIIREELSLTQKQIGNLIIASVAVTVIARLAIGYVCDKIGPRRTYTGLLIMGSIPVMSVGFADTYETFLLFRLAIGVIGASFVITQYHTTLMYASNVVGTANATSAGWGNLGGGITQMVMPLLLAGMMALGATEYWGWRLAMIVPGAIMFFFGIAYYFVTRDTPEGDFAELRQQDKLPKSNASDFLAAVKDHRVWALFVIYGACFGIELTINNIAALYYVDSFKLDLKTAGLIAGLFGLMNIFARTLGGFLGDRFGAKHGLKGRVWFLGTVIFFEGIALIIFSRMGVLPLAVMSMIVFSLFVQAAEGATYSVVPFINKKALGAVAGIVGAGGNAGAIAAGFLFRMEGVSVAQALGILGVVVAGCSSLSLLVRFSDEVEEEEREAMKAALAQREGASTEASLPDPA